MDILLIAATEMEIKEFLLAGIAQVDRNCKVNISICGIGVPSTIYHLTKHLVTKKYDLVIQAGIAGSFSPLLKNGKVVLVKADHFADIGFDEKHGFLTIFESGLVDENMSPYNKGWLINDNDLLDQTGLFTAKAITINTVSYSDKLFKRYKEKYNPDIETMEGAALHFVCLSMDQPFIQLRAISNKVGDRDKANWEIETAVKNMNKELLSIVNLFAKTSL